MSCPFAHALYSELKLFFLIPLISQLLTAWVMARHRVGTRLYIGRVPDSRGAETISYQQGVPLREVRSPLQTSRKPAGSWEAIGVQWSPGHNRLFTVTVKRGLAIAQAVSCWLATAAARVRVRAACGVCDGHNGIGAGFLRVLQFPLPIIPPISPSS
jgi:hypothetical protein